MDYKIFYENIKYLCWQKGIPIGQLEKRINVSAGYISRTANGGVKGIHLDHAVEISKILEIPLEELIYREIGKEIRIKELEDELRVLKGG